MAKDSGSASVDKKISKLENRMNYLARAITVDSFRIPLDQVEKYRREYRRVWTRIVDLRG